MKLFLTGCRFSGLGEARATKFSMASSITSYSCSRKCKASGEVQCMQTSSYHWIKVLKLTT